MLLTSCSAPDFTARFGTIEITEYVGDHGLRFGFSEELKRVPLLTMEEGGLYGLEYRANNGGVYSVELTAIVPTGIVIAGGGLKSVSEIEDGVVLVFNKLEVKDVDIQPLLFSRGDPEGTYILSISVNGRHFRTLEYEVYDPKSAH